MAADDGDVVPIDPDLDDADDDADRGRRTVRAAPPRKPSIVAAVALGGALGAPARYGVAQLVRVPPDGFPWATFWTNVSGSFALGLLLVLLIERFPPSRYARPFFATGFLGAYTTFSTFVVEADVLVKDGHAALAIVYVAASLAIGLSAAWAGITAGRRLSPVAAVRR